ncbi:DUF397 domain-containing protein [Haloechinothrix halophila]|uniref:DUF397 domain-containing protein n=1 Tax=Haloechinothrix halophila TaxID=1069073 RepID=UPI0012F9E039|nr:DUF397 domain-containing protein [Haloechinothrix halophila]
MTSKEWNLVLSRDDERTVEWRTSSYSGGGNDCVEVGFIDAAPVVRDSKHRDGGVIRIETAQWQEMLRAARTGALDLR